MGPRSSRSSVALEPRGGWHPTPPLERCYFQPVISITVLLPLMLCWTLTKNRRPLAQIVKACGCAATHRSSASPLGSIETIDGERDFTNGGDEQRAASWLVRELRAYGREH